MPDIVATSAEVSRNFGEWQDRAMTAPVQVTHHGRPRAVLLSIDAYESLSAVAPAASGAEPSAELVHALKAILNGMAEGFIALDASLRITAVNARVEAFLGRAEAALVGLPFASLEPDNPAIGVFVDRFRWVMRTGEPIRFQARTALGGSGVRTLSIGAFPYRGGVGLTYDNITQLEALKDELAAIRSEREALRLQGGIAIATVTPLGFFAHANESACRQLGFDEAHLRDIRFTDLVRPVHRPALLEAMNRVSARRDGAYAADIEFLCREGSVRPAHLSVAPALHEETCVGLTMVWQGSEVWPGSGA